MLEDFRLRIFVTLASEGSFTKAASRLGISQPAVSQNVAELEKMLSMKLFDRLKGAVELTEEGKVFLKYAENILEAYAVAGRTFSDVPSSTVRISCPEEIYAYLIAPKLQDFISVHPGVSFERCITDAPDLRIIMRPVSPHSDAVHPDSILRLRVSGSSSHDGVERTMSFDIIYSPSPVFECTKLCRLLKEFLTTL